MAKPRVIIADTDENYIAPLQLKFAKEFFDQIDIEIITNQEYFNELFAKPQRAEILIIADTMYTPDIQRHNIDNIFLMQEQYEEEQTGELNVVRLFKYTSIKEVFNEIIGQSAESLKIKNAEKKETQIVVVTSAAGGAGKTTIAMGICACLAKNYQKVLYINADRLQKIKYLFENKTAISEHDVYAKLINNSDRIYEDIKHVIRKEEFYYLPSFKASLMALGIKYEIYAKIAEDAKKSSDYDFIIIDAESTFDEEKIKLFDIADRVLLVTEQTVSSVEASNELIANINLSNVDKYQFICNKFNKEKSNALISSAIELKFSINEYVEEIITDGTIQLNQLAQSNGIKKVTYLII